MKLIWPAEFTPERFAALYRIYVESIPASERKPERMIRAMWDRPDYQFGLAELVDVQSEQGGVGVSPALKNNEYLRGRDAHATSTANANASQQIVGFSILFTGENPASAGKDFHLLEYFAIDARYRNRGVGGELFRQTIDAAARQFGPAPVLIEVESDQVASPDQAIIRKRIGFYRRLGCRRIVGLNYLLPLKWPVPPMELMIRSADESIPAATLRRWLQTIFSRVYGRDANDPRIDQMLADIETHATFQLE